METNGRVLREGSRSKSLRVKPGDRFLVLPYDAQVTVKVGETTYGPWKAIGGKRPGEGCPLRFMGTATTGAIEMTDEELALLETLGYITEDEGEETAAPGAPCGK